MNCIKCGSKTKVLNTRTMETLELMPKTLPEAGDIDEARALVEWYTSDWRIRIRRCLGCGHTEATVEVASSDMAEMLEGFLQDREARVKAAS